MPIRTVTLTVPDPDQPMSELTRDEKQQAFVTLGGVVSRLDTRRRALHQLLRAVDQRADARRILSNLTEAQRQALRAELELNP